MVIGSKKLHALPKFPPGVASAFKSLCERVPVERARELKEALDSNIAGFKLAYDANPMLDWEGAKAVYDACNYLIDNYENFPPAAQRMIIGAVRYCAVEDDLFNDQTFLTGLFDDKKVINYVLEEIGLRDRFLPI